MYQGVPKLVAFLLTLKLDGNFVTVKARFPNDPVIQQVG